MKIVQTLVIVNNVTKVNDRNIKLKESNSVYTDLVPCNCQFSYLVSLFSHQIIQKDIEYHSAPMLHRYYETVKERVVINEKGTMKTAMYWQNSHQLIEMYCYLVLYISTTCHFRDDLLK